jgi:hypothetical protein
MTPVIQTKVVITNSKGERVVNGNCYAAAIASVLNLPITEVPNVEVFFNDTEDYMFFRNLMQRFLKNRGLQLQEDFRYAVFHKDSDFYHEKLEECREELKDSYYLASGKSPRGFSHIVVYKNGELAHDPHPSADGISTPYMFEVIRKIENLC